MKKLSVVLADHERLFRVGLRELLRDLPHVKVVAEVEQGPAALEAVREHQADLLVCEMDLPYWSGVILTRQVRKASPRTAVLLLTRNATEHLIVEALKEGARGYLLKDTSFAQLKKAIQAATADGPPYLADSLPATIVRSTGRSVAAPVRSRYDALSPRERQVLKLLVLGHRNQEVAELLGISVKTVEIHRARIMEKLHLHRLAHLVRFAIERGIVPRPDGTPSIHMPVQPRRGRPAGSKNRKAAEERNLPLAANDG